MQNYFRNARRTKILLIAVVCVLGAIVAAIVGFYITQLMFGSQSSEVSNNSESNPKTWTDSSGLIHDTDGRIYSSDQKWVWNTTSNSWERNWPSQPPSDESLKIAGEEFAYANRDDLQRLIINWAGKGGSESDGIKGLAYYYDSNLDQRSLDEANIIKYLSEVNRPIYNPPPVYTAPQYPSMKFCNGNINGSSYTAYCY